MILHRMSRARLVMAFHVCGCAALVAWAGLGTRVVAGPAAKPDLIVRTDVLAHQWVVRDEKLSATFCSVIEGNVEPGLRRLVRFTVMTPNIGDADINIGDPNRHVDPNGDGDASDSDGLYEFASCHNHYHFRHYATYELVDPDTGDVWKAAKRGFCMLDTDPVPASLTGKPPKSHQFRSCGGVGIPGNQGISAGWADTYRFFLGGQYFVLDGGDGQPPVPPGQYVIRITVNPPFSPEAGEPCPAVEVKSDGSIACHQLLESNYANNVGQVLITIPDHPGKHGVGPLAGAFEVDETAIDEHGFKCGKDK